MYQGGIFPQPAFEPCECCKPRFTTCTVTTHKWTKKEIESRLLELSKDLANARWYARGRIIDDIKHWSNKLDKYKEIMGN